MNVEIKSVQKADKKIVMNLMQFYQYDFTDFGGEHVKEDGLFFYKYMDLYWEEKERYPFLIYLDNELAGLSFVNKHSLLKENDVHVLAEFFILRYFRKKGVGFYSSKKNHLFISREMGSFSNVSK